MRVRWQCFSCRIFACSADLRVQRDMRLWNPPHKQTYIYICIYIYINIYIWQFLVCFLM